MNVKTQSASEYIGEISREYSIYTCQNRGIPSVCDGLKDSQRKGLFVIKPLSDKIKTISLSGLLINSNIYYHSDASASETLSMMAAPYCNNIPLLHGIGAFGTKVGPTDWGAARYTYLKKYTYTESLVYPDFDIIPMKDNYDGSVQEPVNFLPIIPLVLLNGVAGIAVGWSTNILPRTLNDIIDATIAAIDKKEIQRLTPQYDYLNCNTRHLSDNSWEFAGKVRMDGNGVWVEELPPDLSLVKFKERLNQYEEEERIQTYIDRSTKEIKIEIKFKRGTIDDWNEDAAIDFLKLRTKKTERIVVLDWNGDSIKQYESAEDVVKDFVEWRLAFYTARYKKIIDDLTYELNSNVAFKLCYDGKLTTFLSKAKNKQEIVDEITRLTSSITLDDNQIQRIANMASYRWAIDSYNDVCVKIKDLTAQIAENTDILNNPKKQRDIYKKEVMSLKKLPKIIR